ncbi:hypothetical protein SAMN05428975_4763 [Mucilaginibacter sp. OK268]|uniref:hypothetical protein n=1 Tax=Mucilaginibacter sp. OK268 TaxID=1881048 RepID=UPI00088C53E1|nr:hypothetical protein [Mucilaginibacter sp. OK268]SDP98684.1 hypothetical protein SAMN05428975_4763 [Mucilaginibacter sp. OK268]
MKKAILVLVLIIGSVYQAFAQQNGKTKHMIISILEKSGKPIFGRTPPNVFITRDDTVQVQKYVEFNLKVKASEQEAAHENQIMQLLEPYYIGGWKLVSVSPAQTFNVDDNEDMTRFFFTKDE